MKRDNSKSYSLRDLALPRGRGYLELGTERSGSAAHLYCEPTGPVVSMAVPGCSDSNWKAAVADKMYMKPSHGFCTDPYLLLHEASRVAELLRVGGEGSPFPSLTREQLLFSARIGNAARWYLKTMAVEYVVLL